MKIYLYIKTHNITGIKYFGKTTKDPHKYRGSGKYWLKHLRKWGNDVTTKVYGVYDNIDECITAALAFSKQHNIVESEQWANLQDENGVDGAPLNHPGHRFTAEQRVALSKGLKNRWQDHEFKESMREKQKFAWTKERKAKHSEFLRTHFWSEEQKRSHSEKLNGKKHLTSTRKGIPKPPGFGERVSRSLTGRPKSESHKRALSEAAKRRISLSHSKEISD